MVEGDCEESKPECDAGPPIEAPLVGTSMAPEGRKASDSDVRLVIMENGRHSQQSALLEGWNQGPKVW